MTALMNHNNNFTILCKFSASKAIEMENGTLFCGNKIVVKPAEMKSLKSNQSTSEKNSSSKDAMNQSKHKKLEPTAAYKLTFSLLLLLCRIFQCRERILWKQLSYGAI